jgi:hypothetical protein
MMYIRQYALNFAIPSSLTLSEQHEVRNQIFNYVKQSSVERADAFQSYPGLYDPFSFIEAEGKINKEFEASNKLRDLNSDFYMHKYCYPHIKERHHDPRNENTFVHASLGRPGLH